MPRKIANPAPFKIRKFPLQWGRGSDASEDYYSIRKAIISAAASMGPRQ